MGDGDALAEAGRAFLLALQDAGEQFVAQGPVDRPRRREGVEQFGDDLVARRGPQIGDDGVGNDGNGRQDRLLSRSFSLKSVSWRVDLATAASMAL
jgi:hypothetical protein